MIASLLLLEHVTDQGGVETLYMYSATLEAEANFVSRDEISLNLLFNGHFNYSFYPSFYSLELFWAIFICSFSIMRLSHSRVDAVYFVLNILRTDLYSRDWTRRKIFFVWSKAGQESQF